MTTISDAPMLALIDTPDLPAPTTIDQARIVLLDGEKFDQFYARMKAETDAHVADVSTDKGRKEVISLARRVTTTKTAITAAAKGLTEGWREQTAKVNAARRPIEERLSALAEEVRRPVTEWETAEGDRVERNRMAVQAIRYASVVRDDDTAESVEQRGRAVFEQATEGEWTATETAAFDAAKDATVKSLLAARDRLRQEETDRAELERLRAAETERLAREAEVRASQEEADRIERELAAAEQRKRDEAERLDRERQQAADKARRDAEEAAAKAQRDLEAEHARQLAAVQAERDRMANEARRADEERRREAAAQEAERQRIAAADAKRAKDRAHVSMVMGEAKMAIMSCGVHEDVARAIVVAIKAGQVPHVEISF